MVQQCQFGCVPILDNMVVQISRLKDEMKTQRAAADAQKKKKDAVNNVMVRENTNNEKIGKLQTKLAEAMIEAEIRTDHLQESIDV
jgi:predicted Holliday junction resolvase-like endonuclease